MVFKSSDGFSLKLLTGSSVDFPTEPEDGFSPKSSVGLPSVAVPVESVSPKPVRQKKNLSFYCSRNFTEKIWIKKLKTAKKDKKGVYSVRPVSRLSVKRQLKKFHSFHIF